MPCAAAQRCPASPRHGSSGSPPGWRYSRRRRSSRGAATNSRGDEQELPWVRVKGYKFETEEGSASLADLFRGRSQLLVYHFMFGPDYKAGCPSCSAIADGFNGFAVHLANHRRHADCGLVGPSPNSQLQVPSFALAKEDIFSGKTTATVPEAMAAMTGVGLATYARATRRERVRVRGSGIIYHNYSAYSRGVDSLWGMLSMARSGAQGPERTTRRLGYSATTSMTGTDPASLAAASGARHSAPLRRRICSDPPFGDRSASGGRYGWARSCGLPRYTSRNIAS